MAKYNDDGGPAFPICTPERVVDGLSKRDYFAGQALAGMLAAYAGEDVAFPNEAPLASRAYAFADAMLKARE